MSKHCLHWFALPLLLALPIAHLAADDVDPGTEPERLLSVRIINTVRALPPTWSLRCAEDSLLGSIDVPRNRLSEPIAFTACNALHLSTNALTIPIASAIFDLDPKILLVVTRGDLDTPPELHHAPDRVDTLTPGDYWLINLSPKPLTFESTTPLIQETLPAHREFVFNPSGADAAFPVLIRDHEGKTLIQTRWFVHPDQATIILISESPLGDGLRFQAVAFFQPRE